VGEHFDQKRTSLSYIISHDRPNGRGEIGEKANLLIRHDSEIDSGDSIVQPGQALVVGLANLVPILVRSSGLGTSWNLGAGLSSDSGQTEHHDQHDHQDNQPHIDGRRGNTILL